MRVQIFAEFIFAIYDPYCENKFQETWKYPNFSEKPHDFKKNILNTDAKRKIKFRENCQFRQNSCHFVF